VAETEGFLVAYKPPLMHSAPLKDGAGDTLLDWCAKRYPEVLAPRGRLGREGGLLHRLDYGTWGLALLARTQAALESLEDQQDRGIFVKEYGALAGPEAMPPLLGFPPMASPEVLSRPLPFAVESAFRPYGPRRAAVRPILPGDSAQKPRREYALDRGLPYKTEVLSLTSEAPPADFAFAQKTLYFQARIARGFRHQIRCHLAWLGYPVLNDRLYGGLADGGTGAEQPLALKAQGLSFRDPLSGEDRDYRLPPIHETERD
jgi:23S rRNA pseudouridine1911/1915/1917 synthase